MFAAGILHWTADMVIMQGIFNSITAVLGALIAGWMDSRFGSKRSTMVFLGLIMLLNVTLLSLAPGRMFFVDVSHLPGPGGMYPTWPDVVFFGTQLLIAFFRHRRFRDLARPDGEAVAAGHDERVLRPLCPLRHGDVFRGARSRSASSRASSTASAPASRWASCSWPAGLALMLPVRETR